jgi:hypothetical protein
MSADARDEVLALLAAGKISAVSRLTVRGQRAWGAANAMTNRVQLDAGLVSEGALGDLAGVLAHEVGHTLQPWLFKGGTMREAQADAYMCANTWGRGAISFAGGYRSQLGPCGSGVP